MGKTIDRHEMIADYLDNDENRDSGHTCDGRGRRIPRRNGSEARNERFATASFDEA